MTFAQCFAAEPFLITEGAIVERIEHEFHVHVDENITSACFIYSQKGKESLQTAYRQYMAIAAEHRLPMCICSPTRRASDERIARSAYHDKDVLKDNIVFLQQLKQGWGIPIYLGGLMGCRGDAYSAQEFLPTEQARVYHRVQAQKLKDLGVEYLQAGIMPQIDEAVGMAQAMEETGLPYIISFMLTKSGHLLDGTSIHDAIVKIDANTSRHPIAYITNCVHPANLLKALMAPFNQTEVVRRRFRGIIANASTFDPQDLDHSKTVKSCTAEQLLEDFVALHNAFPLKLYGGCCGTNNTHMQALAGWMQSQKQAAHKKPIAD